MFAGDVGERTDARRSGGERLRHATEVRREGAGGGGDGREVGGRGGEVGRLGVNSLGLLL